MKKISIAITSIALFLQFNSQAQCISGISNPIQLLAPNFVPVGGAGILSGLAPGNYFYQFTRTGNMTVNNLYCLLNGLTWNPNVNNQIQVNSGSNPFQVSCNGIGQACGSYEDVIMDIFNTSGQLVCSTTFHFTKPNSSITGPASLCTTTPGIYYVNPVSAGGSYVWSSSTSGWKINGSTSPVTTSNNYVTLQSPFAGAAPTSLCVSSTYMCQSACFAIASGIPTQPVMTTANSAPGVSINFIFTAPAGSIVQTALEINGIKGAYVDRGNIWSFNVIAPRKYIYWVRSKSACGVSTETKWTMSVPPARMSSVIIGEKMQLHMEAITIFPNPAKDYLNITYFSQDNSVMNIVITDVLGNIVLKEVHDLSEGNNELKFQLDNITNGIYFLNVDGKGFSQKKKVVIEK